MKARIVLAGLLGGLALFCWGAVSHMLLGLGDAGLRLAPPAPRDEALLSALKATLPEDGLHAFPGMDESRMGDPAAHAEWAERTRTEPHGLVIISHQPYTGMGPKLGIEAATDVGIALLAALLLSCVLGCCRSYVGRVGFVGALGLVTALRPIQNWNWYGFPSVHAGGQVLDGVLGFLVMGLVIAAIVKPPPPA